LLKVRGSRQASYFSFCCKTSGDLDLGRGSVKLGVMGSIRRTVNVIIALALAALGCGGFVYFYFIAAAWKGWTVISAVMGGVGLYWLSAEYLNWLSAEYLNPDQRPEN
jgi:hypothetical protein